MGKEIMSAVKSLRPSAAFRAILCPTDPLLTSFPRKYASQSLGEAVLEWNEHEKNMDLSIGGP